MKCSSTLVQLDSSEPGISGTGLRYSDGKPNWSLMPLDQVAMIMEEMQIASEWQLPVIDELELFHVIADFQSNPNENRAKELVLQSFGYLLQNVDSDPVECLQEVIAVWECGEAKYSAFNWMKGMPWSEPLACYMRHLIKLWSGIKIDEESGRHHGAHLICNAMMLLHYSQHYQDGNDLPHQWYTPVE